MKNKTRFYVRLMKIIADIKFLENDKILKYAVNYKELLNESHPGVFQGITLPLFRAFLG